MPTTGQQQVGEERRLYRDAAQPLVGAIHPDPGPPDLDGWAAGEAGAGDPEVGRLLAVLGNAGPPGLTVTELVVATGRQKTWVYDRLGDLQQTGVVKRAGQGRYRLVQHPMGGEEPCHED